MGLPNKWLHSMKLEWDQIEALKIIKNLEWTALDICQKHVILLEEDRLVRLPESWHAFFPRGGSKSWRAFYLRSSASIAYLFNETSGRSRVGSKVGVSAENMRTRDWLISYLSASYEGSETKFRVPGSYSETTRILTVSPLRRAN